MYTDIDRFELDVRGAVETLDFDSALEMIESFVSGIVGDPYASAFVFGSSELDKLCQTIGKAVLHNNYADYQPGKQRTSLDKVNVILASHLDPYGGHTRLAKDVVQALPDEKFVVLISDLFGMINRDYVNNIFDNDVEVRISTEPGKVGKLCWIFDQFLLLNIDKVFLFNHHQDAVIISAIQPEIVSDVYFIHHADHNMCLGIHLDHVKHLDPHNIGYYNCRTHEGIEDNYYMPLAVPDRGKRNVKDRFIIDDVLKTCSCGSANKYTVDYRYSYQEVIPEILKIRNTVHFHVGLLPDEYLSVLREGLLRENISPDRFVYIPWVENLWDFLIENNIDLYISSFPMGGGRATIEAMGAGVPLLMHENQISRFYSGIDLAYDGALIWREPRDIYSHIASLTSETLSRYSEIARDFYEKNHTLSMLEEQLGKIFVSSKNVSVPRELKDYRQDPLLTYLAGLKDRNKTTDHLMKEIADLNTLVTGLNQTLVNQERSLFELKNDLTGRNQEISELKNDLTGRNQEISELRKDIDSRIALISELLAQLTLSQGQVRSLLESTSWKITKPLRFLVSLIKPK